MKGTGFMEKMHMDKGGACAVMGALHGAILTGLKRNVIFCMAFAENAIGKDAQKGGDIVKSLKGLTVEIGNTDAEGRLVMGDSLTYVCREWKPKRVIDIATLTGAIMISLGLTTAGVFSNNDDFATSMVESGKAVSEPFWHMPLNDEHREELQRQHADLNNIGRSRYGGSC